MSNLEIITTESMLKNFPFDGSNLFTFAEWRKKGCIVQKGEKAFMSCKLWKKTTKKNKKTGKEESSFMLVTSYLFTASQVKKIELQLTAK